MRIREYSTLGAFVCLALSGDNVEAQPETVKRMSTPRQVLYPSMISAGTGDYVRAGVSGEVRVLIEQLEHVGSTLEVDDVLMEFSTLQDAGLHAHAADTHPSRLRRSAAQGLEQLDDTRAVAERPMAIQGYQSAGVRSCPSPDPFPSRLIDDAGLFAVGKSTIGFETFDGNSLTAWTWRATDFTADGPVLFVMHGTNRTAESYLDAMAPVAERYGALAIAPRFPETLYPSSTDYTLGVYDATGAWLSPEAYLYSELEHLFEAVEVRLGGQGCRYLVFGHSAGAQFTHRLLTFRGDAHVGRAVAANSGWYTLPQDGSGESDPTVYDMPYGLDGAPVTSADLGFGTEMVILLGTEDTATPSEDPSLRDTPEANFQGSNRVQRGEFYFQESGDVATAIAAPLAWLEDHVLGAGHDKDEMAPSAGWYLFRSPGQVPCVPDDAATATVTFREIHADPATDASGDANNDGVRDSLEDEFVELVNTGPSPVCLAGWTLGDVDEVERHRFPIGSEIAPGKALLVFGGGVPTGNFGDAVVQWVSFSTSLSMQNAGDILTLADGAGATHSAFAWGDCGGAACTPDYAGSLAIGMSVVWDGSAWVPHDALSAAPSSPGTLPDGTPYGGAADLDVTLDHGSGVVTQGGVLTYAITVTNLGPDGVTGATVTDTFPVELTGVSWTCTASAGSTCSVSGSGNLSDRADLPSSGTATYTVTSTAGASQAAPLSNTASASVPDDVIDPVSTNDSATVETIVAIFVDGFKSGDTSAWSNTVPAPATLLIVANEAAREPRVYRGSFRLEPALFPEGRAGGETARFFVVSEREGEPYRLGILIARGAEGYRIRGWIPAGEDGRQQLTLPVVLTERPRELSFEWIGASGPGAVDGLLRLFADGRPAGWLDELPSR